MLPRMVTKRSVESEKGESKITLHRTSKLVYENSSPFSNFILLCLKKHKIDILCLGF